MPTTANCCSGGAATTEHNISLPSLSACSTNRSTYIHLFVSRRASTTPTGGASPRCAAMIPDVLGVRVHGVLFRIRVADARQQVVARAPLPGNRFAKNEETCRYIFASFQIFLAESLQESSNLDYQDLSVLYVAKHLKQKRLSAA